MTVLNRNKAIALLEIIYKKDLELYKIIKRLVELKRSRRLSTSYAQDDLNALSITTVAGDVTMGNVINQLLSCDPSNPYNTCNSG
jgi:hypothetical protein